MNLLIVGFEIILAGYSKQIAGPIYIDLACPALTYATACICYLASQLGVPVANLCIAICGVVCSYVATVCIYMCTCIAMCVLCVCMYVCSRMLL